MTLATGADDVLRFMLDGRSYTRLQLIEKSGLGRSTVNSRIDALLASGLVVRIADTSSTGGRPPARFALNPGSRCLLAVDVGVRNVTVAVTDLLGNTIDSVTREQAIDAGAEEVLGHVVRFARWLLKSRTPAGTGIGLPGVVNHETGTVDHAPMLPGWAGYDVAGRIQDEFGGPAFIDNDVNLMALGEQVGTFPDARDLIFVKVAGGIGAGIISGGVLQHGARGVAGELGHLPTPGGHDIVCRRCGNTGCLGAIASATAISANLERLGIHGDLMELARAGDSAVIGAIRQAGREIGSVLASCVNLLNPSVIVIGGSLAEAGEPLLSGIRENIYARSLPLATANLLITTATSRDVALKGAAAMAVRRLSF